MTMTALDTVIAIDGTDDIVAARQAGRELATKLEFSLTDVTMITTAISEVARNISTYAGRGKIRLGVTQRHGRQALTVQAIDSGPGIADVERALEDGFSTSSGLGLGLPGARRLMDDFELESEVGVGTTVTMWKWLPSSA
jgi:serine/threonine-protein kinase RsbT